jgi:hypothetical protein
MVLAYMQAAPHGIDTTSMVSIGVLVVVVGAAIRVTSLLSRIDERLRRALEELSLLAPIPGKVALLEQRVSRTEADVDELWATHRAGDGRRREP